MKARQLIAAVSSAGIVAVSPQVAVAVGAHVNDSTPGCVDRAEYAAVKSRPGRFAPVAWTRRHVNRHFGSGPAHVTSQHQTAGFWGVGEWRAQDYRACWNGRVRVSVEFVKAPDFENLQRFKTVDVYTF